MLQSWSGRHALAISLPARVQIVCSKAGWVADGASAPAAEHRGENASRRLPGSRKPACSDKSMTRATKEQHGENNLVIIPIYQSTGSQKARRRHRTCGEGGPRAVGGAVRVRGGRVGCRLRAARVLFLCGARRCSCGGDGSAKGQQRRGRLLGVPVQVCESGIRSAAGRGGWSAEARGAGEVVGPIDRCPWSAGLVGGGWGVRSGCFA
jgi:hypothetical protein